MPVEKTTHVAIHLSENESTYCGRYNISREDLIKQCEQVNWEIRRLNYDFNSVKQWLQQYRINYILEYTNSYSKRFYEVDEKTNKAKKPLHLPLNKSNITYALDLSNGDISLAASYFGVSVEIFKERADNYEILSNHNIYKIEYLESVYQVYDLEVEQYHNFIAGELCVHNCSEPNLQQIPSHNKEIRMMFRGGVKYNDIEANEDDSFIVPYTDEVETDTGWKYMKDVLLTDKIKLEDNFCSILEIIKINEQGDYKLVLAENGYGA